MFFTFLALPLAAALVILKVCGKDDDTGNVGKDPPGDSDCQKPSTSNDLSGKRKGEVSDNSMIELDLEKGQSGKRKKIEMYEPSRKSVQDEKRVTTKKSEKRRRSSIHPPLLKMSKEIAASSAGESKTEEGSASTSQDDSSSEDEALPADPVDVPVRQWDTSRIKELFVNFMEVKVIGRCDTNVGLFAGGVTIKEPYKKLKEALLKYKRYKSEISYVDDELEIKELIRKHELGIKNTDESKVKRFNSEIEQYKKTRLETEQKLEKLESGELFSHFIDAMATLGFVERTNYSLDDVEKQNKMKDKLAEIVFHVENSKVIKSMQTEHGSRMSSTQSRPDNGTRRANRVGTSGKNEI